MIANSDTLPTVSSARSLEVVKRIKSVSEFKMSHFLDGLSANVNDALFEEMQAVEEQDALAWHFNIMRALKTSDVSLCSEFNTYMNLSWVHLVNRRDRQTMSPTVAEMESLLKTYGDKNLNHYKVVLEEVRLRFCTLVMRELIYHPMLPANFYLCFWHASEKFDLSVNERRLLMSLFNRFVMARFGTILGAVNQTLIELHVHASQPGDYTHNIDLSASEIS